MSGKDIFSDEMKDVEPIKQDQVINLKREADTPGKKVRRRLAVANKITTDPLSSVEVPMLQSNDILEYKRDGVQNGVYKKLRMGKYELEAQLDLHRMTVEDARLEVFNFLSECYRYELRTVIILHGKGDRNPEKIAILKSHVANWLPQIDDVIAFHSAQERHGGTGAVYIMLKKSVSAKQRNRESHDL